MLNKWTVVSFGLARPCQCKYTVFFKHIALTLVCLQSPSNPVSRDCTKSPRLAFVNTLLYLCSKKVSVLRKLGRCRNEKEYCCKIALLGPKRWLSN